MSPEKEKLETRSVSEDQVVVLLCVLSLRRIASDGGSHILVFVHQTQGQDLSTLSPAIIFKSMFQNSDDTAIQEDPQQTGLLYSLSSCPDLSTGKGNSHIDSLNDRHGERLFQFL